ncbi:unnamed protein product [Diamesa hyperborea]
MKAKPCRVRLGRAVSVSLDLLIFLIAAVTLILIEALVPSVPRGFICEDPSISFKFEGDTIPVTWVIISGLMPLLLMWIVEFIFYDEQEEDCAKHRFKTSWRRTLHWFKSYGISLVILLLVMDVIKVLIGEPRPHFLDSCRPNTALNCTKGMFVPTFTCLNKDVSNYTLRDSSRSFPSGHACLSVYSALFMIWYLQIRVPKLQTIFLIPFMQTICMIWVSICSVSRITDHRHHWWDVLGGLLLGILSAFFCCYILCKNFESSNKVRTIITHANGSTSSPNFKNRSVRRLLSTISSKEEFTLNSME